MLTAVQQERYSRHLLLEGFDQDKVRQASIHVCGRGEAALWAARYLAASGCGTLVVDDPSWHDELRRLGPWTDLTGPAAEKIAVEDASEGAADGAMRGAQAALDTLRQVLAK
jgi:hypothetical protein